MKQLPLSDVRVVDLTRYWAGPYATQLMGSLGAEVIRVEATVYVDAVRYMLPPDGIEDTEDPHNRGSYFHMGNRNKDSIALDLQTERGRDLMLELVSIADVVIENYSARVMGNLRLDYDDLRKVRPDLIMISMPSFGRSGPYRDYVCFGEALEGMTGLSNLTGHPDGPPVRSSGAFTDPASGMWGVYAVLAALERRRRTGKGARMDLSQQEGYIGLLGDAVLDYTMNGRVRKRIGNRHPSRTPQGAYRCKGEDEWVAISAGSDAEWESLCRAMGREDLLEEQRYRHILSRFRLQEEIDEAINAWTSGLGARDVMARLQGVGVQCGIVAKANDLFEDPHFKERGFFETTNHASVGEYPHFGIPFKMSKTPGGSHAPAPRYGEHNRRVFCDMLGLGEEEYAGLIGERVSAEAPLIGD